ncbi:hypothetical protein AKJ09_02186 [Labilithrix luteola]|uniref:Uncharacterized protein n=1 Tax=Labilithrix luteola TaxID=1391654 RepID=A0A0K1PPS5_9BACT|nr:hypothetical protein [Labilithrix luteola]AKU95522.1 hypothetical protein AKJ09_02186 [Labilithrix luteola]
MVIFLASTTRPAHAEDSNAPLVEVVLVQADDERLEAALRELLSRIHVTPRFARTSRPLAHPASPSSQLLAAVDVDFSDPHKVRVAIVDTRHDRVLVHEIATDGGVDEVVREEISHITVYAVEALLRGEVLGTPREVVPATPIEPIETPTPPTSPRVPTRPPPPAKLVAHVELETEASVRTYAPVAPVVFGTGAALALSARPGAIALRGALLVEQRTSVTVATQSVSSRFAQHALRADVSCGIPLAPSLDLVLGVGAGLDFVSVQTTVLRAGAKPATENGFVDRVPVIGAFAGTAVSIAPRLTARADVGVDVPVRAPTYVVDSSHEIVLLSPYTVRGVVRVGLDVRF